MSKELKADRLAAEVEMAGDMLSAIHKGESPKAVMEIVDKVKAFCEPMIQDAKDSEVKLAILQAAFAQAYLRTVVILASKLGETQMESDIKAFGKERYQVACYLDAIVLGHANRLITMQFNNSLQAAERMIQVAKEMDEMEEQEAGK